MDVCHGSYHTITYFNLLLSLADAINQSKQANVSRLYDRIPVYCVDKHVSLLCKRAHILSYTDKTPALIDLYFLSVFLFFNPLSFSYITDNIPILLIDSFGTGDISVLFFVFLLKYLHQLKNMKNNF